MLEVIIEIIKFESLYIVPLLTFIVLFFYAYFTYVIAKDVNEPVVSAIFEQVGKEPHLRLSILNNSKVETESLVKIKIKTKQDTFEFSKGDYGGQYPWRVQPFTKYSGNFELKNENIKNEKGESLWDFVKLKEIDSAQILLYLKYRKSGIGGWKEYKPYLWTYNFKTNSFWQDIHRN